MTSRIPALLFLTVSALMVAGSAYPRECPSKLPAHLFAINDQAEGGMELRTFYFGASVGEGMPGSDVPDKSDYENNVYLALKPQLNFYPHDDISLITETELRYIWPGWKNRTIPGLDGRPTQLFVEYDNGDYGASAGLQPQTFGTGAVLDQRIISAGGRYRHKYFELTGFAGITARNVMRNASSSMWMRYASDSIGWKTVSTKPWENYAAGLTGALRIVKPFRLQMLYLFAYTSVRPLRSHTVSVNFSGPVISPYLSFVSEGIVFLDYANRSVPGLVLETRSHFWKGKDALRIHLGIAGTYAHDDVKNAEGNCKAMGIDCDSSFDDGRRFMGVYENLSWGMVRRFSLYHGHLAYLKASWPFIKYVKPFVHYYMQSQKLSSEDLGDELDAGVDLAISDLYRLRVSYVGLNLASQDKPSHAVYAEFRLILGEQISDAL